MAGASNNFEDPTRFTNVVLIVEGRRLHLLKELLASHSPVFEAMFFGEFAEKDKDEVEINDVVYEEFLDLLKLIHEGWTPLKFSNVSHVLKLSDRFQMKGVIEHCVIYLQNMTKFNIMKKLLLAEQYNLQKLKDHCINSFKCANTIARLTNGPEYGNLSDDMKNEMNRKIMELLLNGTCNCKNRH